VVRLNCKRYKAFFVKVNRPGFTGEYLLEKSLGDAADQIGGNAKAVDLFKVGADVRVDNPAA
jgi:hypothetical protein